MNLLKYAIQFYLGRHKIKGAKEAAPVYLERSSKSWVVRIQLAELNPYYLNITKPHWRYKYGDGFSSKEEAIEVFEKVQEVQL